LFAGVAPNAICSAAKPANSPAVAPTTRLTRESSSGV
jgi:hypothetical protein